MAARRDRRSPSIAAIERGDGGNGQPDGAETTDSAGESPADPVELLGRPLLPDEANAWAVMSPSLRRRALDRVALLRRWTQDRGDLTAVGAAAIAGVTPKRFYQMASAWKKQAGLLAVGAYAAAPVERSARIDPVVNAALQVAVVKAVASSDGASIEDLRREAGRLARLDLSAHGHGDLDVPSPNVVRAIVTRELNRVGETTQLGESLALDCCPTTMRSATGEPWAMFAILDRGTLRVMGTSVGSLDMSAEGYAYAARRALLLIRSDLREPLPWAVRTRRADMVVGRDVAACATMVDRYEADGGAVDFQTVTRERRFGSLLRRYVGDRIGRVLARPTWAVSPPPLTEGDEVFERWDAAARLDREAQVYNGTKALARTTAGAGEPPSELIDLLRVIAGGPVGNEPAG